MPGVFSARWAGRHGDDLANLELVLAQIADVPDEHRGAAFVCAAALVLPGRPGAPGRRRACAAGCSARRAATAGSATTRSSWPTGRPDQRRADPGGEGRDQPPRQGVPRAGQARRQGAAADRLAAGAAAPARRVTGPRVQRRSARAPSPHVASVRLGQAARPGRSRWPYRGSAPTPRSPCAGGLRTRSPPTANCRCPMLTAASGSQRGPRSVRGRLRSCRLVGRSRGAARARRSGACPSSRSVGGSPSSGTTVSSAGLLRTRDQASPRPTTTATLAGEPAYPALRTRAADRPASRAARRRRVGRACPVHRCSRSSRRPRVAPWRQGQLSRRHGARRQIRGRTRCQCASRGPCAATSVGSRVLADLGLAGCPSSRTTCSPRCRRRRARRPASSGAPCGAAWCSSAPLGGAAVLAQLQLVPATSPLAGVRMAAEPIAVGASGHAPGLRGGRRLLAASAGPASIAAGRLVLQDSAVWARSAAELGQRHLAPDEPRLPSSAPESAANEQHQPTVPAERTGAPPPPDRRALRGAQASGPTSRFDGGAAAPARRRPRGPPPAPGRGRRPGPGSPANAATAATATRPAGDGASGARSCSPRTAASSSTASRLVRLSSTVRSLHGRRPAHRDVVLLHADWSAASRPRRARPAGGSRRRSRPPCTGRSSGPELTPGVGGEERRQVAGAGARRAAGRPGARRSRRPRRRRWPGSRRRSRAARRGSCRSTRPARRAAPPGCPRRTPARGRRPCAAKSRVSRAAPATCGAQRIEYASCTACARSSRCESMIGRVLQQPVDVRGRHGLARVRPDGVQLGQERPVRAEHRLDRQRGGDVGHGEQVPRRRAMASSSMPSMPSVPLISASPSLAASSIGRSPAACSASAAVDPARRPCRAPSPRRAAPARSGPAGPGRRTRRASRAPAPTA